MKTTAFFLMVKFFLTGILFYFVNLTTVLAYENQVIPEESSHQQSKLQGTQSQQVYESSYGNKQQFGYLEYLPAGYDSNHKEYPLIISLHDVDQISSGDQIEFSKIEKGGQLARRVIEGQDFPFIIITPQQPEDVRGRYEGRRSWDPNIIDEVLERVKSLRRVDLNRVYICGESMGGGGVWKYLELYGEKIAAAVPIAGPNTIGKEEVCNEKLISTPIWAFHCENDMIVDVQNTIDAIQTINLCNPPIKAKQTIYSSRSHNAWDWTYDFAERTLSPSYESSSFGPVSRSQDIFSWMLSHKLKPNEKPVAHEDEKPKDTVSIVPEEEEQHGLRYAYFEGEWNSLPNFADLNPKEEGIAANFTLEPRKTDSFFGFHFKGYLEIDQEGEYEFFTTSDHGSRLYIDGQLIVDNNGAFLPNERQGKLLLKSGMHTIELMYFERQGSKVLNVSYSGPEFTKKSIPSDKLFVDIEHPTLNCGEFISAHNPSLHDSSLHDSSLHDSSLHDSSPYKEDLVKAYPSHLDHELMIEYSGVGSKNYQFVLYDQSGKILYMGSALLSKWQNLQLDLIPVRIPKGLVYLRIQSGTDIQVVKLFKL